jgi:disulfide bond formation protein DsbB
MILAFSIPLILLAILLSTKKKLLRKHWYMLFSLGFVLAFIVSFVSVWSVWSPYERSDSLHEYWETKYSGASSLSYPLELSVYVVPLPVRNFTAVQNISFDVSVANQKVLETNGTLSFDIGTALIGNPAPLSYQLGPPFHSDAIYFFGFLLFLFTLFNMVAAALGLILAYVVSRYLARAKYGH